MERGSEAPCVSASYGSQTSRPYRSLAEAGAVEALIPMLTGSNVDVKDASAVALAHVSSHSKARKRVWSAGVVTPLVATLPRLGFRGMEGAAVCLENLIGLKEAAEQLPTETVRLCAPVLQALLYAVRHGQAQASYFALRAIFLLSGVDSSLVVPLAAPDNIILLCLRAWHGKPEAQSVALLLLRDIARQHPKSLVSAGSGSVTLLLGLQVSPIQEVSQLATETIHLLSHLPFVKAEASLQESVDPLIQSLAGKGDVSLSRMCERALRSIPRGLYYHTSVTTETAYCDCGVSVIPGHVTEPPSVASVILQKLRLSAGQHFLEVGCGSGYMTALAAHIVGASGSATGIDISSSSIEYAQQRCQAMHAARRLGKGVRPPRFVIQDAANIHECGRVFDAVVVAGEVSASFVRSLRKICSENGRIVASVEKKLQLFELPGFSRHGQVVSECSFPEFRVGLRGKQGRKVGVPGLVERPPQWGPPPAQYHGDVGGEEGVDVPEIGAVQPRLPDGGGLLGAGAVELGDDGGVEEDAQMASVMCEIEKEHMSGLLVTCDDVEICRTSKGRKWRLGEGGFGIVYKALMNGVDEVAVKVGKAANPKAKEVEQFLTEVRTLAKLHHRNVVQFYGACLDPERSMFIVTELMKGGDLYSALRHHPKAMCWNRLGKKVALDVALGINYLHSRKPPLLHRDLKSPNVLLSEEGIAKIADVGMARAQVKDLVTAQPVMTPLWAAPEVIRQERASVKADIWSFGILLWELVSGCDITEYQPLSVAPQDGKEQKGKLMVLPDDCPPVVARVFFECTKADPLQRPSSQDIVEWLRRG